MVLCYKGGGEMKKHGRSRIVFIATDQVKVKTIFSKSRDRGGLAATKN